MKEKTKYSECNNKILKYAWECLEPKLKEDFNIDLVHVKNVFNDRSYSVLDMMIDGEKIGQITAPYSRYEQLYRLGITAECYERTEKYIKHYWKKYAELLVCTNIKEKVIFFIESMYDSDIFTGVIELINYKRLFSDSIIDEYNAEQVEYEKKKAEYAKRREEYLANLEEEKKKKKAEERKKLQKENQKLLEEVIKDLEKNKEIYIYEPCGEDINDFI